LHGPNHDAVGAVLFSSHPRRSSREFHCLLSRRQLRAAHLLISSPTLLLQAGEIPATSAWVAGGVEQEEAVLPAGLPGEKRTEKNEGNEV